ncbi:MAG: alpha/beta hydrolase [Puniceicoccales bacterium]|jgi:acetyl esterase|nr:alpha/beta hydrolase [Puniceicoccales bacterium]
MCSILTTFDGSGGAFTVGAISKKILEIIKCDGVTHEKLKQVYENFRHRALAMRRSAAKQLRMRIDTLFKDTIDFLSPRQRQKPLTISDILIPSLYDNAKISARFYRPDEGQNDLILYFHGGGWMQGSVQNDDDLCCKIARGLEICVLSIEYRLAPENPFPIGLDDAVSSYVWANREEAWNVLHGNEFRNIYICGESSGGNLAASAILKIHDEFGKIKCPAGQILFYPPLSANLFSASYDAFGKGHILTGELLQNFYYNYLGQEFAFIDKSNSYIFPCSEPDATKFVKTLIIAAGLDPLRSSSEEFATKLRDAGVPVIYYCFSEVLHGFLGYHEAYAEEFAIALQKIAEWIES